MARLVLSGNALGTLCLGCEPSHSPVSTCAGVVQTSECAGWGTGVSGGCMLGAWLEAVLLQQFCSSVAACVHCVLLTVNVVSGVSIYRVVFCAVW
jgi:hypothetical protein